MHFGYLITDGCLSYEEFSNIYVLLRKAFRASVFLRGWVGIGNFRSQFHPEDYGIKETLYRHKCSPLRGNHLDICCQDINISILLSKWLLKSGTPGRTQETSRSARAYQRREGDIYTIIYEGVQNHPGGE
jgi:hypothetical protein